MVKLGDSTEDAMSHTKITVKEEDVLKLVLEFLRSRNLHVTMRTLEKESGVINCEYTDEILFLRELILDGDWDEVLLFAHPFDGLKGFESDKFKYIIYKQKFLEMLSLKSHIVGKQMTESIEEVIKTLSSLEKCCPSKEEYSNLCWLLTVPDLNERIEFRNWSLDNSRMKCFDKVVELLHHVLPMRRNFKRNKALASRDRLLQLIIKGLFYESCVDYCQAVAIGNNDTVNNELIIKNDLITGIPEDYSANLLSWIRSLGANNFGIPFEQIAVEIAMEKYRRPTQITQSLDVPKMHRKKEIDVETLFRSLVDDDDSNGDNHYGNRGEKLSTVDGKAGVWHKNERGSLTSDVSGVGKLSAPSAMSSRQALHTDGSSAQEEKVSGHSQLTTKGNDISARHLQTSTDTQIREINKRQELSSSSNFQHHYEGNTRRSGNSGKHTPASSDVTSSGQLQYSYTPEDLSLKDLKEKQRLDVTKRLESYERERKAIEKELYSSNSKGQTDQVVERVSTESRYKEKESIPQEDRIMQDEIPSGASASKQTPVRDNDYYDSLKRPQKHVRNSENTPGVKAATPHQPTISTSKTPSSAGPSVTSTPKQVPKTPRETPPPQISPVIRQAASAPPNRETKPRRAMTKETLPQPAKRAEPKHVQEKQETPRHVATDAEQGKENTLSTSAPSEPQPPGVRKGPMINGVRRTLAANPNQVPPSAAPLVQGGDADEVVAENVTNTKTVPGNNTPSKPTDAKPNNEKTKPAEQPTRNIKGTGPTIRIKDGTKVAVTELLKSRDEIKNAVAVAAKPAPNEENNVRMEEAPTQVEVDTDPILKFEPVCKLEDMQAVRAVAFHPKGNIFAVGANSKTLRICSSVDDDFTDCERGGLPTPVVLFKRTKYHRGSIYCVSWSPDGEIIATGSNDKTIKLMRFNTENCIQEGVEVDLTIHTGTVRELAFIPSKSSMLISGGAGDGGIPITDCETSQTIGSLQGHSGTVMAVYAGEGDLIATGATDNTLRLWDLRSQRCIDVVMVGESNPASVALSYDGAYMATGQEDGCILLYDITAGRTLQSFRLHQEDCRSVRFSPDSKFLLTGSYDNSIDLLHIEKGLDTTVPKHYVVGSHRDKVIQCRWHPWDRCFLSSSADRTVMLWKENTTK